MGKVIGMGMDTSKVTMKLVKITAMIEVPSGINTSMVADSLDGWTSSNGWILGAASICDQPEQPLISDDEDNPYTG